MSTELQRLQRKPYLNIECENIIADGGISLPSHSGSITTDGNSSYTVAPTGVNITDDSVILFTRFKGGEPAGNYAPVLRYEKNTVANNFTLELVDLTKAPVAENGGIIQYVILN